MPEPTEGPSCGDTPVRLTSLEAVQCRSSKLWTFNAIEVKSSTGSRPATVITKTSGFRLLSVSLLAEFWTFLRVRKKLWLLPILVSMFLLGGLIVMTEGSAIAPFLYTLF